MPQDAGPGAPERAGRPTQERGGPQTIVISLFTLSDDQIEYQPRNRLSFMPFAGPALHDAVPDAKTIGLFRERRAWASSPGPLQDNCPSSGRY